jgi:hypothetical protein
MLFGYELQIKAENMSNSSSGLAMTQLEDLERHN